MRRKQCGGVLGTTTSMFRHNIIFQLSLTKLDMYMDAKRLWQANIYSFGCLLIELSTGNQGVWHIHESPSTTLNLGSPANIPGSV